MEENDVDDEMGETGMLGRVGGFDESFCYLSSSVRVCSSCCGINHTRNMLKCAQCKVAVYCGGSQGKICQKRHWKEGGHSKSCKKGRVFPPKDTDEECKFTKEEGDDPDLDVPYNYILLREGVLKPNQKKGDFGALACGILEDKELDNFRNLTEQGTPANSILKERYGWRSEGMIDSSPVAGFGARWGGVTLRAFHDDSYTMLPQQQENQLARLILMNPMCRGPFVLKASTFVGEGEQQTETKVGVTRRDVLSLAVHINECGKVFNVWLMFYLFIIIIIIIEKI